MNETKIKQLVTRQREYFLSGATLPLPAGLDWITVSPKAGNPLVTTSGDELKLVWPQEGCS